MHARASPTNDDDDGGGGGGGGDDDDDDEEEEEEEDDDDGDDRRQQRTCGKNCETKLPSRRTERACDADGTGWFGCDGMWTVSPCDSGDGCGRYVTVVTGCDML